MLWQAVWIATMVFWLIFLLIWMVIASILAIWVYQDAKKRKFVDETLWLIIVLLTGIFGFLIYYFVIRKVIK